VCTDGNSAEDLAFLPCACVQAYHLYCITAQADVSTSCPLCRAPFSSIACLELVGDRVRIVRELLTPQVVYRAAAQTAEEAEEYAIYAGLSATCSICRSTAHDESEAEEHQLLLCEHSERTSALAAGSSQCRGAEHVGCLGLTSVPRGAYYCRACVTGERAPLGWSLPGGRNRRGRSSRRGGGGAGVLPWRFPPRRPRALRRAFFRRSRRRPWLLLRPRARARSFFSAMTTTRIVKAGRGRRTQALPLRPLRLLRKQRAGL
jgi:hypothetical protein